MAKVPSFEELYARNQAEAEADPATPTADATCPTITLNDLLAGAQRYAGGDLAPAEARSFDPPERSFAFERGVRDLGGPADPNQAGAKKAEAKQAGAKKAGEKPREKQPGAIALPDANADSLVLCGLSDTLTKTKR